MYAAGDAWLNRRRPGSVPRPRLLRPLARAVAGIAGFAVTGQLDRARMKAIDAVVVGAQAVGYLRGNAAPRAGALSARPARHRRRDRLLPRPHRAVRHPRGRRARGPPAGGSGWRRWPGRSARSRAARAGSRSTGSRTRARSTGSPRSAGSPPVIRSAAPRDLRRAAIARPRRADAAARARARGPPARAAAASATSTSTSRRLRPPARCGSARLVGVPVEHHPARARGLCRAARGRPRSSGAAAFVTTVCEYNVERLRELAPERAGARIHNVPLGVDAGRAPA